MKNVKKIINGILALLVLIPIFMPFEVLATASENVTQDEILTEAELDVIWNMMTDERYENDDIYLTEVEREAFVQMLISNAETYVANLSDEDIAEIEAELEEFHHAEEYFWENFSPDFLWEMYLEDNPEVLRMRNGMDVAIQEEINAMYETVVTHHVSITSTSSPGYVPGFNNPVDVWTRIFSADFGLTQAQMRAIEVVGLDAGTSAAIAGILPGWNDMRVDAYRHWLWNYRAVRNHNVGPDATTRYTRTRIFTTHREIASIILDSQPSLITTNPTANQLAMGRYLRVAILGLNQAGWRNLLNTYNGRYHQMDLWNNYWGRIDGLANNNFNPRWNSTVVNTGLVRGNGTGATQMSVARQNRLWAREKAFPVGGRP